MARVAQREIRGTAPTCSGAGAASWSWLGLVPFFLFAVAFLIWPATSIVVQSFHGRDGALTLDNIVSLADPAIRAAFWYSIELSAVTALGGGILGFLLAYAVTIGGLPRAARSGLTTFSGVASNFAGVPLAFAFIATLGRLGLVTTLLKSVGLDLYSAGFTLYNFWGLSLTYIYFQIPLMVLIIAPALDGLKREWREASENLGANAWQYWRLVALPVLLPSILGAMVLLFGNAFGAHATAFALTGGGSQTNVVTLLIGAQLSGDALQNPGLGNALALGMIVIMAVTIAGYSALQRRSERWLR